jgi:hypothetical protein
VHHKTIARLSLVATERADAASALGGSEVTLQIVARSALKSEAVGAALQTGHLVLRARNALVVRSEAVIERVAADGIEEKASDRTASHENHATAADESVARERTDEPLAARSETAGVEEAAVEA